MEPSGFYPELPDAIPGFDNLNAQIHPLPSFGTRADRRVAAAAMKFLAGEHRQPFLLVVSIMNPHDICYWIMDRATELEQLLGDAPGEKVLPPLPPNFAVAPDEPEFIAKCRQQEIYGPEMLWTKRWTDQQWRSYLYAYYRFVEQADARVGDVLSALRESGLDASTLVLLTSGSRRGAGRPPLGDQAHAVRGVGDGAAAAALARSHTGQYER